MTNDVLSQLAALRQLVDTQALEIANLRADVRHLELGRSGAPQTSATADVPDERGGKAPEPTLSRRAFARLGAMAGVGAAAATVAGFGVDTSPAAAMEGADVRLGKDNRGAIARTGIFGAGASTFATLADPKVNVSEIPPADAGVVGNGSIGILGCGVGADGYGVLVTDGPINGSPAEGSGLCTGVSVTLEGPANNNSAVNASTYGTGVCMAAYVLSPSSIAETIVAANLGQGACILVQDSSGNLKELLAGDQAVKRPLGFGPGLVAQLENPDNLSPAVAAHTLGSGPGLDARATSGAAVSASSVTGPAAELSSDVAHLRLVPGPGEHPAEGASGDLFVDAAGHLWFCRDPGSWVKLA